MSTLLGEKALRNVEDALGGLQGRVEGGEGAAPVGPGVEGGSVPQALPRLLLQLNCRPNFLHTFIK